MKRILLMAFLLILSFNVIGCSQFQNTENINSLPVPDQKITTEDINEGKQVIRDYVNALKSRNLEDLNKTLGMYKNGLYNKDNIGNFNSNLEIDTIAYPGKYLKANIPPSSYKSNYGKDPYKSMCLHVTFTEGTNKKDWDYILIKETEQSPWVIHDWGV
ncbi:DUF4829 domain-containing protein [Desulfosporosinus nitroreducens]|uniref:DUF4829 domain-containing protein n=1 Tax=Desulfosporosinus nitroreducens TaxID=2018668 RepID=UPI00207CEDB3|nr:DUF4829 domain-containing protein [Desulfosporosinus nitroreducens]MCO1600863.1 DUF4829 domain-containing protein [Desulfosporosinus nitroreducens]